MPIVSTLICVYAVAIAAQVIQGQVAAIVTQGTLMKVRNQMFDHMEDLPIRYFDTTKHGDIMSHYTNDVDTLRQLISQALPNLLSMFLQMAATLFIMLWY